MFIVLTEWHKTHPNDWVAQDVKTYEIVDRDIDLLTLRERLDRNGVDRSNIIFCKGWFVPDKPSE